MKPLYITTPIYYVNDVPHLGTAYTTAAADVLARYARLKGRPTWFLTGTDEHGEKLQQRADQLKESPESMVARLAQVFRETWTKLGFSFDDFIRTTEERHKSVVLHYMKELLNKGDVYYGQYEGWYCVSDESFWTQTQLVNDKCPSCGRDVKKLTENNYFFKISKYTPRLLEYIERNPHFILPEAKRNEVVSLLKEGVRDISVSRTTFSWGIPFPQGPEAGNEKHVIYVWFDALPNYVSALNPLHDQNKFQTYWPEAIHLLGKDILKFHAIYWPCFLMALGLPLPKRIFAHGWWTVEGQKMSKSLGNAIEPVQFVEEIKTKNNNPYASDAFRLYLFREFPLGSDGDFSLNQFKTRINADLANNLGNLVSRNLNLITKNLEGQWSPPKNFDSTSLNQVLAIYSDDGMERFDYFNILNRIFEFITTLNKYFDTKAPWTLAKDPAKKEELKECLEVVAEGTRLAAVLLQPFIPEMSVEILKRLGVWESLNSKKFDELVSPLTPQAGRFTVQMGPPLFPRLQ